MDTVAPAPNQPPPAKGKKARRPPTNTATTSVVCSASSSNNSIELGLILSLVIFCLYFYGFLESIQALPDVPSDLDSARHLGDNLNLAKEAWDIVEGADEVVDPSPHRSAKQAPPGAVRQVTPNMVDLPESKWPATVRAEDGNFENILHPGDGKTPLSVPKFWSPPVHKGGFMTRELAMKIGTCNEPDSNGNIVRGDDCPLDERTIYFAIASYRDFQCRFTVESAFLRAKNPHRIRVGE